MRVSFTVQGKPQPQGSTRAFMPKGARFPIVTTDNKTLKPWRQDVSSQALLSMAGEKPTMDAVHVTCKFYFVKPKSVHKSIVYKITKPDLDKLLRGIFDGMTGICFLDDSQIVSCESGKYFCDSNERAEVEVMTMPPS